MLSESYPPLTLSVPEQQRASECSPPALTRSLSRLAGRRGGWAAFGCVLLAAWATWSVASWLLERWQIR